MIELAVITRNPKFSGTCFDSFEYFYRLWELEPNTKYITKYPQLTKDFINTKYNINQECFKNIIYDEPYNYEYKTVLFFDTHCFETKLLKAKNIFVIANSDIQFKEINDQNIQIFSEFFHSKNYTHCLYFDIHKVFKHSKNTYINAMDLNYEVLKIISQYKPHILKNPKSAFQHYSLTNFKADFYKDFDNYVYIKTPKTFDRHPRMFSECVYQGINCEYINIGGQIDPSWIRFEDRFDLNKRDIKNDKLIEEVLK